MSQETKVKRLDAIDARIKRAERKARDLRASASHLDAEVKVLKAEQEWLNDAPTRPTLGDSTQAYEPDTQEGKQ